MELDRDYLFDEDTWKSYGDDRPVTWEEDGLTVTRTTARTGPGCHNGCFALLYTDKDGKLVKVEGDPEMPYNEGRLCARCLALPEVVNHPDRLKYPMRRKKEDRGKDKWERITWDEALDEITTKFNEVKEKYGAKAATFVQGTGRDISTYILRLAWAFGSPNPAYLLAGSSCYLPRIAALYSITGSFWIADCSQSLYGRYDDPDYVQTELMVIWGNNPLQSNADGFFGHWVVDMIRRGTKLIVIDPRVTWLSCKSEMHLQLRSGTDGALALAILNVIINEELYDKEFVDNWCYGFEQLAERVQEYPVEFAAKTCWLEEADIIAAARMIAAAKPCSVQMGLALDMSNAEAIPTIQGITSIWAITNNFDVPGGMLQPYFILSTGFGWGYELLTPEQHAERIGVKEYPFVANGFNFSQPDLQLEAMRTGNPYPIKATWFQTTNPLACTTGELENQLEAYLNQDIVVVVDLFMTPTAMACADYVLPASTFAERDGIRTCDGPQFGATINKACTIGEAKGDPEICWMFGKRWNPEAYPWDTVEEMHDELLRGSFLGNVSFKEVQQAAPVYKKQVYRKHEKGMARGDGQLGFNTASGRIELFSLVLQSCNLDPLPYYEEPDPSPVRNPELWEKYPFILGTGARDFMSFHSEHRQVPTLRNLKQQPEVEINPKAAEKLGIKNGDWVWLENENGRCQHLAKLTYVVPEHMVMADHGWWFPEEDGESPHNYGIWRVNVNQLLLNVPGKSGFGTNFKSRLCKVYKVKDGE